jgi:HSP20 family protein
MTRHFPWWSDFGVDLQGLQGELNRLIARYRGQGPIGPTPETVGGQENTTPPEWVPAIDLSETPESFRVVVDLPGVNPAAIDLSVVGTVLTLRGDRPRHESPQTREHLNERPSGVFLRALALPSDVDVETIEAKYQDGVLTVTLPKAARVRPRTIPVHST